MSAPTRGGLALLLALCAMAAISGAAPAQEAAAKITQYVFGDPLPPGAMARLGTSRLRQPGWIESFCFSPDSQQIASVCHDYLCLWDAKTGKRLHMAASERERYQAIAYSPDGTLLAIGIGGLGAPIVICDAKSLKEIRRLNEAHTFGGVGHLVFSPDSKTLYSSGSDEQLRIWDPHAGKLKEDIHTHTAGVSKFDLSQDGRLLAWGTEEGDIHIRDLAARKPLRGLAGHKRYVSAVAFSPDGALLASASHHDGTFRIFDVATGFERLVIQGDSSFCTSVLFSKDGKTLFAVERDVVRLLDPKSGKEMSRIEGRSSAMPFAVLSPDGKTLGLCSTRAIHLFDPSGKPRFGPDAHDGGVDALVFTPDGKTLITGAGDSTVRIWDPWTGKVRHRLTGHKRGVSGIALSGDGKLLASAGDFGPPFLWDTATGKKKLTLDERGSYGANAVALSPDAKALACSFGPHVTFSDARTGKYSFFGRREGEGLLPGGDRGPRAPGSHGGPVHAVAYSHDGKLVASGSQDRTVRIWDAATGFQIHKLAEHSGEVHGVAFSPDGRLVAAAAEKSLSIWHVATGKRLLTVDEPALDFWSVAFSPDGRLLAAGGSKRTLKVWEVITGREIRRFDGHEFGVTALAFTPDGKHLASGSYDCTVLLWNLYDSTPKPLDAKEMKPLWERLAVEDAAGAHEAMSALIGSPRESVEWVRKSLRPAEASSVKEVAQLIAQLDSANFTRREQAARALEKSGPDALFALTRTLEKAPPVEVRRRIEKVIEKMMEQPPFLIKNAEERRALRAVIILEQIGGPESLTILQTLAKGEPLARLTHEAENARRRLASRLTHQ